LAQCLGKLKKLKRLDLSDCFEGQELEEVMLAIGDMRTLTCLSFEGIECCTQRMSMTFGGFLAFTVIRRTPCRGTDPMLQQLSSLKSLDLTGLLLPTNKQQIAASIASMTGLTNLCLCAAEVGAEVWKAFAPMCTQLTQLATFDISRVDSIDADIMNSFAESMVHMRQMEALHLTGTHVGTAAAAVFKSFRSMPLLRKLGMARCHISCAQRDWTAAVAEMSALGTLSALEDLVLSYNDLGTISLCNSSHPRLYNSQICFTSCASIHDETLLTQGLHNVQVWPVPRFSQTRSAV
jgi:Leucine-rich repeat (LRR) protein